MGESGGACARMRPREARSNIATVSTEGPTPSARAPTVFVANPKQTRQFETNQCKVRDPYTQGRLLRDVGCALPPRRRVQMQLRVLQDMVLLFIFWTAYMVPIAMPLFFMIVAVVNHSRQPDVLFSARVRTSCRRPLTDSPQKYCLPSQDQRRGPPRTVN
jgi:hypothetical protein